MDYSSFDVADFAADRFFVSWVLSPNEQSDRFWNQWSADHPDKSKVLYEARLLVLLMESRRIKMDADTKESLWDSIQSQTFEEQEKSGQELFRPRAIQKSAWLKIAATFLVIMISAYVYFSPFSSGMTVVENRRGEKTTLYLPDGTKVWLNAESRISYPTSFENSVNREVELQGEAFFDVTKNELKPFIVRTSQLQVKVLGTAFNVRSYDHQETIETTLVHGSVMIELNHASDQNQPILLKANEQAIYSTVSKKMALHSVKADSATSWRVGKLTFQNKPFSEIEEELERWYGVDIQLEDPNGASCRFSTTIENEPIGKILELFKATSDITYEIENNHILIKGKLCTSHPTINE